MLSILNDRAKGYTAAKPTVFLFLFKFALAILEIDVPHGRNGFWSVTVFVSSDNLDRRSAALVAK